MSEPSSDRTARRAGGGSAPLVGAGATAASSWALLLLVSLAVCAASACSNASVAGDDTGIAPLVGEWRGVLLSEGGELPFHFRVNPEGSDPPAIVLNAGAEQPLVAVTRQGAASYTLRFFNDSDSQLVAKMSPDGTELSGYWRLTYDPPPPEDLQFHGVTQMPFSATKNDARRFQRNDPTLEVASAEGIAAVPDVNGDWTTHWVNEFMDHDGREMMVQEGERVVTGGPGAMEGIYRNGLLRLSMFDGYRALLLHARATSDGRLEGTLWLADQAELRWTAQRAGESR